MKVGKGDRVKLTRESPYIGLDGVLGTVIGKAQSKTDVRVEFDDGESLGCFFSELELVQKKEKKVRKKGEGGMEIPKVYKALVEKEGGELVSIWAGTHIGGELSYQEGQVTYAPEDSIGIFVEETLEESIYNGKDNSTLKRKEYNGTLVVHEAIPLGQMFPKGHSLNFEDYIRYPAILLGKEVWRQEPEKPKEEWVDVTKECTYYARRDGDDLKKGAYVLVIEHNGEIVGHLFVGGVKPAMMGSNYQIEISRAWFTIFRKIS